MMVYRQSLVATASIALVMAAFSDALNLKNAFRWIKSASSVNNRDMAGTERMNNPTSSSQPFLGFPDDAAASMRDFYSRSPPRKVEWSPIPADQRQPQEERKISSPSAPVYVDTNGENGLGPYAHLNGAQGKLPGSPNIDKDIENIFAQNKKWRTQKLSENPMYFDSLGSTHKPPYMWIGCADARVPANEIMGEDAGSVFVARNVANLVVNTDINLMAALQFAVNSLQVTHIIVCGHYDCGGVRASMEKKDHMPPLENWLRNIRDVYRLHREELDAIKNAEARHRRLVELNVIEQCINLFKTGAIQRRRVQTYKEGIEMVRSGKTKERPYVTPRIHACVFDPKVGILERLEVDFKQYIDDLHDIYDLYTLDEADVLATKPHAPKMLARTEPRIPEARRVVAGGNLFSRQ